MRESVLTANHLLTHTPEAMTITRKEIHTTEGALETITSDGDVHKLGRATINGHSMPALTYRASQQTVVSDGGRKLSVSICSFSGMVDIYGGWGFGHTGTAKAHEKSRIQKARAQSLVNAVS